MYRYGHDRIGDEPYLCSDGLNSYGLYSDGLCSYGLYNYGRDRIGNEPYHKSCTMQ